MSRSAEDLKCQADRQYTVEEDRGREGQLPEIVVERRPMGGGGESEVQWMYAVWNVGST